MSRSHGYLLGTLACAGLFIACVVYCSHSYWGTLGPQHPGGEYLSFGHRWPDPLGIIVWYAVKPLLLISMAGGIWSAWRFVALRRAQVPTLACLYCGYDLTGNVSGVCPECGTAITKSENSN